MVPVTTDLNERSTPSPSPYTDHVSLPPEALMRIYTGVGRVFTNLRSQRVPLTIASREAAT